MCCVFFQRKQIYFIELFFRKNICQSSTQSWTLSRNSRFVSVLFVCLPACHFISSSHVCVLYVSRYRVLWKLINNIERCDSNLDTLKTQQNDWVYNYAKEFCWQTARRMTSNNAVINIKRPVSTAHHYQNRYIRLSFVFAIWF